MTNDGYIAPWYRQPWFWFLAIFPLAAIIWGSTMLVVASSLDTSMVTDDYSKEGRGINMAIARDEKARDLQLEGSVHFQAREATLKLKQAGHAADYPYLVMNFYHPTIAKRDRVIQFRRTTRGEYTASLLENLNGRWYYDLQGPENNWRIKGEIHLPEDKSVVIKAPRPSQG